MTRSKTCQKRTLRFNLLPFLQPTFKKIRPATGSGEGQWPLLIPQISFKRVMSCEGFSMFKKPFKQKTTHKTLKKSSTIRPPFSIAFTPSPVLEAVVKRGETPPDASGRSGTAGDPAPHEVHGICTVGDILSASKAESEGS